MAFLFGRSSRAATPRPWFYAMMAIGFAVLAVWAGAQGNWLVAAFAATMVIVTAAGGRYLIRALAQRSESTTVADDNAAEEVLP